MKYLNVMNLNELKKIDNMKIKIYYIHHITFAPIET